MTYERLKTDGFLITGVSAAFVIARPNFGDGYDAAQTISQERRKWKIKIDVLPDMPGSPLVAGQTRALYLWEFFKARKAAGDEPFWLKDPKDDLLYLATFADEALLFDVLCDQIFAAGLQLIQRRARDEASPIPDPGP